MVLSADGERGPSPRPWGLTPVGAGARGRKEAAARARSRRGRELTLLQRTVLGALMNQQPANAYAIVKALRHPDGESLFVESSIYRVLASLVEQGYLQKGEEETGRGPRPTYAVTMKGIEAIERWVSTPAKLPFNVANETWLRIASTRFSLTRDVMQGLSGLPEEVDARLDDLELVARIGRRDGPWDTASELEYELERELLHACRRWAATAIHLLGANVPHEPSSQ